MAAYASSWLVGDPAPLRSTCISELAELAGGPRVMHACGCMASPTLMIDHPTREFQSSDLLFFSCCYVGTVCNRSLPIRVNAQLERMEVDMDSEADVKYKKAMMSAAMYIISIGLLNFVFSSINPDFEPTSANPNQQTNQKKKKKKKKESPCPSKPPSSPPTPTFKKPLPNRSSTPFQPASLS
jgi:hypothetical protein